MTEPQISALHSGIKAVTVSVVSHGHGPMLVGLLQQLLAMPEVATIIVTLNIPEPLALPEDDRIVILHNAHPQGFGANHNQAFAHCKSPYFCVLNPDIMLHSNPFGALMQCMQGASEAMPVGVAAPAVLAPDGAWEDSMRRFPTLVSIARKLVGINPAEYATQRSLASFCPEWVAGMFMLFPAASYACVGGFDERYFLYYEDVDICVRLWRRRLVVVACPEVHVVHDARRASRHNLRHLKWHVASISRYFLRYMGRLPDTAAIAPTVTTSSLSAR